MAQSASELGGGGARTDRDRHTVLDGVRGNRRDRRLRVALLGCLDRRPRFFTAVVSVHRAAVHLAQQVLGVQGIDVAPHGHLGDVEFGGQISDPHGSASGNARRIAC